MGMQVVLVGTLLDGFRCVGPFKTLTEADAWCESPEHGHMMSEVIAIECQDEFSEDE